jgi:hypothetical protein
VAKTSRYEKATAESQTTGKSWLLGSKSTLSVSDKIVPYKILIKTI